MIDISVTGLTIEFEVGKKILDGLTFQVDQGERVGLLGRNGAGKTTLLKLLTGELRPDEGEARVAPGKEVGLISQIPTYPAGYTVADVLNTAFDHLRAMEAEMNALAQRLGEGDKADLRRYDALTAAFEAGGGYHTEVTLGKVCNGLDISPAMREQPFDALSGGEKTRVNLARLLLRETEILLLDEPTNHLDLHATEWLEDYLARYKGTVLAISHDRWFLDKVVQRCVEIKGGKAEFYAGNYSFYVEEKERRFQEQLKQYQKEQAKLEQLQEAVDKMRLWAFMGNDKLYKRAFSMEKRMEKLQSVDKPTKERRLTMNFGEKEFRGDEVFTVKGLAMAFGGRRLFDNVDLEVAGGERIALLGDNGAGKSTFVKILLGELEPTAGKLRFGPTVKIGYLPQLVTFDRPERNLVDTLLYDLNCTTQEARDRLAAFNFRGEDVFKEVSALSGGERSRLKLCELMSQKINLLILDEPTNHLDVDSRDWIEEAIRAYEGNLLFVSHDRWFIKEFAQRVWMLENQSITDFKGTYEEYLAYQERQKVYARNGAPPPAEEPKKDKPKRPGGTKELEKRVNAAERAVAKAEEKQFELTQRAEEVASNYLELQKVLEEQKELEEEIAHLYTVWETLAAELEEAKGE
ncbi:ribosomal protection-like ABC-F family protein [Vermiculatibacterium agrestimuris]|uniref:ribosomal protection-like ABC-F family protein n=1 Tax=Vermiculatibacterium agrestimuris TaxID=2941519 RepID=UPI00203BAFC4|nr:ABC-F family ATP-binding cassette domain-containing protein [Vermiculatibacterium agrestimuris]